MKFIEESFDINKKNEGSGSSNKLDVNTSTIGNTIIRERNNSKKDSTLKFIEENMIFNEKFPIENSPPRYMLNQNNSNFTKKVEISQETGEYEFESRRKKR